MELLVVMAIIGLLAVFAAPFARDVIIQGKTEPTAGDINKIVTKLRGNYSGLGATPYAAINTAVFSNAARGIGGSLTVTGAGAAATTQHDLGVTGSQVTVAPATITVLGDAFTVSLETVNNAACPGIASLLNRSSAVIRINAADVKTAALAYNASTAQNACTADDTNTFVFTFR